MQGFLLILPFFLPPRSSFLTLKLFIYLAFGFIQQALIILGSNIRMVTGRVFLGHRVDAILNKAHCPVAVITAPQSLW
ncbi:sodium/hydrogen exchanger [Cylindrospermum sp. NIES-4074]|nr:sodium/hydrogen exchanger [Cylindrospermum sp. NIES-4074]